MTRSARRPGATAPRSPRRNHSAVFKVAMRMAVIGSSAERDGRAHHGVDAPLVQEIAGDAVVGAEAEAPAVRSGDRRQQRVQVRRVGGLPNQDIEAQRQLLGGLGRGRAFVFAADAGGGIGVERLARAGPGHARRPRGRRTPPAWPAPPGRPPRRQGSSSPRPGRRPCHRPAAAPGRRPSSVAPLVSMAVAGTHEGAMITTPRGRRRLSAAMKRMPATPATLAISCGIGHHRGDAVGQHRLGELGGDAEAALDMDVGVDQTRGHVGAGQINVGLAGVAAAYAGNALTAEPDVGLFDLAGKYVDQAARCATAGLQGGRRGRRPVDRSGSKLFPSPAANWRSL